MLLSLRASACAEPKQYGHCAKQLIKRRMQPAAHRQSDHQLVLLTLRPSACAEPKTVRPLRTAAGQRRRQQATHCQSDPQLVLLLSRTSGCAEPKQYSCCAQQPAKVRAASRAPPKRPAARASLVAGIGLCQAKTIMPLRTAASRGASSKPRIAKATSSSSCSCCGPRLAPSQNGKTAAHSSRPRGRQQAAHRRSNEQLVLLSSRTSACAEPKQ